jgi:hypothetical protein
MNAIRIVMNCCTHISPWPFLHSTSLHNVINCRFNVSQIYQHPNENCAQYNQSKSVLSISNIIGTTFTYNLYTRLIHPTPYLQHLAFSYILLSDFKFELQNENREILYLPSFLLFYPTLVMKSLQP